MAFLLSLAAVFGSSDREPSPPHRLHERPSNTLVRRPNPRPHARVARREARKLPAHIHREVRDVRDGVDRRRLRRRKPGVRRLVPGRLLLVVNLRQPGVGVELLPLRQLLFRLEELRERLECGRPVCAERGGIVSVRLH